MMRFAAALGLFGILAPPFSACADQPRSDEEGPPSPVAELPDSQTSSARAADTADSSPFRAWVDEYGCNNTAT
jgi:hypothetical protein